MLGPIKWRLLTIVAGILFAHAIDSPRRTPKALPRNIHDTDSGVKVEKTIPWNYRVVRNLFQPDQVFTNTDSVRFIGHEVSNDGKTQNVIGSFRLPKDFNKMSRRSDDGIDGNSNESSGNQSIYDENVENYREPKRSIHYIPLKDFNTPQITNQQLPQKFNIESSTIPGIIDVSISPTATVSPSSHVAFPTETPNDLSARRSGIQFQAQSHKYQNVFIPQSYSEDFVSFDAIGALQRPYNEELSPDFDNRYARGVIGETQPSRQFPIQENYDAQTSESNIRATRIEFNQNPTQQPPVLLSSSLSPPQSLQQHHQQQQLQQLPNLSSLQPKTYRDDVTKFGDVNGPVTAIQRPHHNEFSEKQLIRPSFETGFFGSSAFGSDGISDYRSPRHYVFPPKAYIEYSDYPGPPRPNANPYYKTNRSPRVVFPQDVSTTGFPSGPDSTYSNDNVVFR